MLYASRFSFCCSHCRKRRTSPSARFFERRVYLALVILLMAGRLTARTPGAQAVCALLDISSRTLRRWRDWWMQDFPLTSLWKAEVACFLPPVLREDLPFSLLARFTGPPIAALLDGLVLLTPLTIRQGQGLLDELDAHAALGELLHQAVQVVEVARQAVHAMHHHRVALAHQGEQPFQLGALRVLARCHVGEQPVHRNKLKLAFRVLVEAADADVADTLTVQRVLLRVICQEEIYNR